MTPAVPEVRSCVTVGATVVVALLWSVFLIASLLSRPKQKGGMRYRDAFLVFFSVLLIGSFVAIYFAVRG